MPGVGLEPTRSAPADFKSAASASSATPAGRNHVTPLPGAFQQSGPGPNRQKCEIQGNESKLCKRDSFQGLCKARPLMAGGMEERAEQEPGAGGHGRIDSHRCRPSLVPFCQSLYNWSDSSGLHVPRMRPRVRRLKWCLGVWTSGSAGAYGIWELWPYHSSSHHS